MDRSTIECLCAGLVIAALGCLSGGPTEPPELPDADARDRQILTLERSIARDRRSLEDLVTKPRDENMQELHDDAVLREIAARITVETRRLRTLRSQHGPSGDRAPTP